MVTREILRTYTVADLKKEISKSNIGNYHKLKKEELIDLMLQYRERFMHLKGKGKDDDRTSESTLGKTPRQQWLASAMAKRLEKAFPRNKNVPELAWRVASGKKLRPDYAAGSAIFDQALDFITDKYLS